MVSVGGFVHLGELDQGAKEHTFTVAMNVLVNTQPMYFIYAH